MHWRRTVGDIEIDITDDYSPGGEGDGKWLQLHIGDVYADIEVEIKFGQLHRLIDYLQEFIDGYKPTRDVANDS